MIYVTADQHYFHRNVIKYCNRPYKDENEMNKGLMKNHNSIVSKDDTVYHLGDVAMLGKERIMKLEKVIKGLNGIHHLILGNHDENHAFTYLKVGFATVHTALWVEEFILLHDPAHAVAVDRNQKILCGHIHDLAKFPAPNILNVGVDIWNYKPISIEEVRREFNER